MSLNIQHEQIALQAYEFWCQRGRPFGSPVVDWIEAESLLRLRAFQGVSIVFDTNAYRNLDNGLRSNGIKIGDLCSFESRVATRAYASPHVIIELASHLWDPHDPHFAHCRAAMASLYLHCRESNGQLRCLADAESLVAHMLYDRWSAGYRNTLEVLSKLAKAVADSGSGPLPPDIIKLCRELADHINKHEQLFVDDMKSVVEWLRPGFQGWDPFSSDRAKRKKAEAMVQSDEMLQHIATAYVFKARVLLGIPLNAPEIEEMAEKVFEHFPGSVHLYRWILERLMTNGWDPTKKKRTNSIWDMQVLMGVGERLANGLPKIVLVTADKEILQAAANAGKKNYVHSLDDYLSAMTREAEY